MHAQVFWAIGWNCNQLNQIEGQEDQTGKKKYVNDIVNSWQLWIASLKIDN